MAWIIKDSANAQIERRETPYLTAEMREHLEKEYIPRYPDRRAALLPTLHEIQHTYNWIPYQALEEAAEFCGITAAEAWDTATFYEEFFLKPKGKYLIQICQSISCELCGANPLLENFKEKYAVEDFETTDDGKFTFMPIECLGACGDAPVALINEDLKENITWDEFSAALDALPYDPTKDKDPALK